MKMCMTCIPFIHGTRLGRKIKSILCTRRYYGCTIVNTVYQLSIRYLEIHMLHYDQCTPCNKNHNSEDSSHDFKSCSVLSTSICWCLRKTTTVLNAGWVSLHFVHISMQVHELDSNMLLTTDLYIILKYGIKVLVEGVLYQYVLITQIYVSVPLLYTMNKHELVFE